MVKLIHLFKVYVLKKFTVNITNRVKINQHSKNIIVVKFKKLRII